MKPNILPVAVVTYTPAYVGPGLSFVNLTCLLFNLISL